MSIYRLKTKFQNLLRPISDTLASNGFTANQVTLSAIALSVGTAYIIARPAKNQQCYWLILPVSLFTRMAMNAIDGMIAKEHNQKSDLGAVLNELGDLISDGALILSLSPHLDDKIQADLKQILGMSLTTELIAIASSIITGERANHGPLGKSDRAFLLGLIGLLVGSGVDLKPYQKSLLTLTKIGLGITIVKRGLFIYKNRQSKSNSTTNFNDN